MVQFIASLNSRKLNASMSSFKEMNSNANESTFTISHNSLKILKETGYDFSKSFKMKLEESNRKRSEALERRRNETIAHFTQNRTPKISNSSKKMSYGRGDDIFQKL